MRLLIILLLCATFVSSNSNENYTPPEDESEISDTEVIHPDPEDESEHEIATEEESAPEVVVVVEPEINEQFAAPQGMCNVTITFGERKLLVSKAYLAIHSPVIAALFSGGPGNEAFSFEEQYEEFVTLMQMIFPGEKHGEISDTNVLALIKLATRFRIEHVVKSVEKFLIASLKYPPLEVDKLLLADQYALVKLRDYYLGFFATAKELAIIKSAPEYESLSDGTKAAVLNRMMTLYPAHWC
ncbi:hypothetical protein PMAYCL1PPCAC_25368 [Pristionchus mayeri]|uniref:BTB domain-containing protein n=1 Tax=Pristionchus mayeri TaxID=1317129 RepID=A0AAN5D262_9BILA|nr:hypothetical protein PMAYCL1PPCAC_25368 [Pristionchus mayeri]